MGKERRKGLEGIGKPLPCIFLVTASTARFDEMILKVLKIIGNGAIRWCHYVYFLSFSRQYSSILVEIENVFNVPVDVNLAELCKDILFENGELSGSSCENV